MGRCVGKEHQKHDSCTTPKFEGSTQSDGRLQGRDAGCSRLAARGAAALPRRPLQRRPGAGPARAGVSWSLLGTSGYGAARLAALGVVRPVLPRRSLHGCTAGPTDWALPRMLVVREQRCARCRDRLRRRRPLQRLTMGLRPLQRLSAGMRFYAALREKSQSNVLASSTRSPSREKELEKTKN